MPRVPVIPSKSDSTSYWAAEPDSERAAANVSTRIKRYRDWLKESGRADRMVRGWQAFYGYAPGGDGDTSQTGQSGEQGEYVDVTTNDFATLVTQTAVMTTANKPAFKAIATNADSASMEQASFAQGLLEFYDKTHSITDRDYEVVMIGQVSSEGWEIQSWDASAGKNLTDFAPGEPTHEGDIRIRATTPFRVAYDPDAEDVDSLLWLAFKYRDNRFDLAQRIEARDPIAAEKLRSMSSAERDWSDGEDNFDLGSRGGASRDVSGDLVWVWEFRHLPSPSLPNGRLLKMVNSECVIFDSFEAVVDEATGEKSITDHGYPYSELHAYRFSPDVVIGSIAGHTPAFDLLGLQELRDTFATQMASAANAGGILNLWTQSGDKPELSSTVGGMNFLQSKTEPKPIQGIQLSPQVPAADEMVDRQMMRRMGQSDVSMGEVPKGMPGNLAALLEAKTVQYHSRGQASFAHVLERSRTGLLKILKRFAKTERVAVLGGKANGYKYKSWTAEDLSGVDRFTVESINPLTQTYAGKMDAAKELLDHGMIESPAQYLLLRETGRLEPMLESTEANLMSIRKEKEMLTEGIGLPPIDVRQSFQKGGPVFSDDGGQHIRPLIYDKHYLYIPEDLGVLAMPQARDNAKLVSAVTGVVEERVRLMKLVSPVMLALLKYPPEIVQAIMQERMPMLPPGGPDGTQPPKPGESSSTPPPKQPETPGLPAGAPRITAAKPPKDPITGVQQPSPIAGPQLP